MIAHIRQRLRLEPGSEGFIIVAVLWIFAALATLASIIAVYVINAATAFTVHDERLQAETMARAAIELTVYQVSLDAGRRRRAAASRSASAMPRSRRIS